MDKTCRKCWAIKDASDFPPRELTCKSCKKDYYKNYYLENRDKSISAAKEHYDKNKDAIKEYRKYWYSKNKDKISEKNRLWRKENVDRVRKQKRSYNYKIDQSKFDDIMSKQNGSCAICGGGQTRRNTQTLSVDHCHKSGVIRGLLCQHCNSTLGMARDNPETLESAAAYLRSFNAAPVVESHATQNQPDPQS